MKRISLLLAFFPFLLSAQAPADAVKEYFKKVIATPTGATIPTPSEDLKQVQLSVEDAWALWCESFTEASCYTKQAISADAQGAYDIPASLEPNARMPYYYGT